MWDIVYDQTRWSTNVRGPLDRTKNILDLAHKVLTTYRSVDCQYLLGPEPKCVSLSIDAKLHNLCKSNDFYTSEMFTNQEKDRWSWILEVLLSFQVCKENKSRRKRGSGASWYQYKRHHCRYLLLSNSFDLYLITLLFPGCSVSASILTRSFPLKWEKSDPYRVKV